jgi:hypothetical protein
MTMNVLFYTSKIVMTTITSYMKCQSFPSLPPGHSPQWHCFHRIKLSNDAHMIQLTDSYIVDYPHNSVL